MGSMEVDLPDESNGSSRKAKATKLDLFPVSEFASGEGLPYAPEDWPNPGDKWSWRVGRRVTNSGTFLDRYMYLPARLQKQYKAVNFPSKLSLQRWITATFPAADVCAFFASFSWKIPSKDFKGNEGGPTLFEVPITEQASDSQVAFSCCKAGNTSCISLQEERDPPLSAFMACDICCSETGFCRDCCCILCSRIVDSSHRGYSFIRCEAVSDKGLICGHIGHLECGISCYLAGTVGGSIGLDAEYFCRRCDATMDLFPHISELYKSCKSIDSRDEIGTILNICSKILRGSSKPSAKKLFYSVESATVKLKNGSALEDIWKTEDVSANGIGEYSQHTMDSIGVSNLDEPPHSVEDLPKILSGTFDFRIESLKLEDEIDQVLLSLRKSQDLEYRIAEETLRAQKNCIFDLYEHLDKERGELEKASPSTDMDLLLDNVYKRVDQIKREVAKLRDMKAVAKGFGKTPKEILKEHFSVESIG